MSATREFARLQSAGLSAYPTFVRVTGWILIVIGILLSLTLVGAILGIPLVLAGVAILFVARYIARQLPALSGALAEQAEIAEDRLHRARERNAEQ